MSSKTIVLIRGLPGAGKSTLAEALKKAYKADHWEADMFHMVDGEYRWYPENVHKAHRWCQDKTAFSMWEGKNVIVSNTFTTEKELGWYLERADAEGYKVVSIIVENRHGNVSIHGVPEEVMQNMENRFSVKLREKVND